MPNHEHDGAPPMPTVEDLIAAARGEYGFDEYVALRRAHAIGICKPLGYLLAASGAATNLVNDLKMIKETAADVGVADDENVKELVRQGEATLARLQEAEAAAAQYAHLVMGHQRDQALAIEKIMDEVARSAMNN